MSLPKSNNFVRQKGAKKPGAREHSRQPSMKRLKNNRRAERNMARKLEGTHA